MKRLLIVRNPGSPLLDYIDLAREGQKVILIQDAVYSEKLRAGNAFVSETDAKARKIDCTNPLVDYGHMVEAIFEHDQVVCI